MMETFTKTENALVRACEESKKKFEVMAIATDGDEYVVMTNREIDGFLRYYTGFEKFDVIDNRWGDK